MNGITCPQMIHDVTEIVEAASVGGRRLASLTYAAVVQARGLSNTEASMLSGIAQRTIRELGIVLWRRA
jgi:hypothetical protein